MIEIRRFKRKFNIDTKLPYYREIHAVESEVAKGTVYCFSDGKFAVLKHDGVVYCPINEWKDLADKMVPEIRQEIYEVVEVMGVKA